MTASVFKPNKNPVNVTETALAFFKNNLRKQELHAIRISIKKSGCAGFSYVIEYGEKRVEGDSEHNFDGVKLYLSQDAIEKIKGSEIDLKVEGLNKNIVFNNPNVTASCGCGTSFSVD